MIVRAIAEITDPEKVQARSDSDKQGAIDSGAIYVSCAEIGATNTKDFIYCRYAMSIPYIRVLPGLAVWIEPTVIRDDGNNEQRWIYKGFADAGGESPTTNDQLILAVTKFFIKSFTDGKINQEAESDFTLKSLTKLILDAPKIFLGKGATEAAVLGNTLQSAWANSVDSTLQALLSFAAAGIPPSGGPVDVGGIPPLVGTVHTNFNSNTILSNVVKVK